VTAGFVAAGLVLGAAAAAVVRRFLFVVTVRGGSMEPALREGDRLLCRRAAVERVRRGDIVVVERPDTDRGWEKPPARRVTDGRALLVKRAAAVPGDPVPRADVPALAGRPEARVPPGCLVVLGDNGAHSFDSKRIGYVPADRLCGVAVRRLSRPAPG